ncbi:hypothetical protein ACFX13_013980 [Malus domestica]
MPKPNLDRPDIWIFKGFGIIPNEDLHKTGTGPVQKQAIPFPHFRRRRQAKGKRWPLKGLDVELLVVSDIEVDEQPSKAAGRAELTSSAFCLKLGKARRIGMRKRRFGVVSRVGRSIKDD